MADKRENELTPKGSFDVETDYIRTVDSDGLSLKEDAATVGSAIVEAYVITSSELDL